MSVRVIKSETSDGVLEHKTECFTFFIQCSHLESCKQVISYLPGKSFR